MIRYSWSIVSTAALLISACGAEGMGPSASERSAQLGQAATLDGGDAGDAGEVDAAAADAAAADAAVSDAAVGDAGDAAVESDAGDAGDDSGVVVVLPTPDAGGSDTEPTVL